MNPYWISRLDYINEVCLTVFAFSFIGACFGIITWALNFYETDDQGKKVGRVLSLIFGSIMILSVLGYILTPTTKEMISIISQEKALEKSNETKESK